jgi:hypothetical protein
MSSRPLPAAGDGTHAWIAVERTRADGTEHVLLHHALPMGCDCVHEAMTLPRAPEAMAAHDGRVWVILPPESAGGRREVYSLRVRRNPATGAYYTDPAGRMEMHPGLAADGAILAAGAPAGDLVVQRAGAQPEILGPRGWGPAQHGSELPVPAPMREPIPGAMADAVLLRTEGGGREIRYARPEGDLVVAALDPPDRAFAVIGVGGRFGVFLPTGEGGAAVRWIDAIDGTQSAQALLVPQPASAVRSVCAPVGTVALAGCLIGLLAWRMTRLKSGSGERR